MTGWARDSFFLLYAITDLREVKRCTLASKRLTGRYSGNAPDDINRLTSAISHPKANAASLMEIMSLSSVSDSIKIRASLNMLLGYTIARLLSRTLIIHLTSELISATIYSTPNSPPKHANATMGLAKQYWRY